MKKLIVPALFAAIAFAGCSKDDNDNSAAQNFDNTKNAAITDFVSKLAIPGYEELKNKSITLNTAIVSLNSNTSEANLLAAKNAWKDMRSTWEKCEGYLFGPIENDEYDPETDTWPVNFNDMNLLLASAAPLATEADIAALNSRSLKGYHPIEYMLWGQNGNKAASAFTAREKEYLTGLSLHLEEQAGLLYNSWIPSGQNYADKFLKAGTGSTVFVKKQDAFLAINDALSGICDEVGGEKMKVPYNEMNPQIVESPFSGNSTTDFKNNIIGAYNVYQGNFNADGTGLQDLVKLRNSALNVELEQKFNAAINSFGAITLPYEQAIITQRTQCLNTMNAINDLSATIDVDLKAFITSNITD